LSGFRTDRALQEALSVIQRWNAGDRSVSTDLVFEKLQRAITLFQKSRMNMPSEGLRHVRIWNSGTPSMTKWQIESRTSGVVLAVYEVPAESAALDQMAREAGYRDYAAVCEELAAPDDENSEIVITKLEG
jgi:hypothetical protein